MTTNDDGVLPAWDRAGDTLQDDGLAEDSTAEDVSDGTIGTLPHLLQLKLLHASLIWRNGRALDADVVLEDGLCGLDRNLVVCLCELVSTSLFVHMSVVRALSRYSNPKS